MSGLRGVRLNTFWGNHLKIIHGVTVLEQVSHMLASYKNSYGPYSSIRNRLLEFVEDSKIILVQYFSINIFGGQYILQSIFSWVTIFWGLKYYLVRVSVYSSWYLCCWSKYHPHWRWVKNLIFSDQISKHFIFQADLTQMLSHLCWPARPRTHIRKLIALHSPACYNHL